MSKVWQFITALLSGVIVGIILWEKIDYKAIYKGKVKIKQKGDGNISDMDTYITVKEARKLRRERRKAKKL